jgi:hypothetical protein
MKPALHLIWSPILFSITGFVIACGINQVAPTPTGNAPEFERFVLTSMPAAGLFIGWFIAYVATPTAMRPETTFITDALAAADTNVE